MKQWSMILMIAGLICIAEGLVRLKKPDLRFFQIRQTEELEPEQRREYIRKGAVSSICLGAVCLLGAGLYGRIGDMKVLILLLGGILLFLIYSLWLNKKYLENFTLLSGAGKKERMLYILVVVVLYAVIYWGFYQYAGLLNHSLAMFLITAGILLAAQMILFRKKK